MNNVMSVSSPISLVYGGIVASMTLTNPVMASASSHVSTASNIKAGFFEKNNAEIISPFSERISVAYPESYWSSIDKALDYSGYDMFLEDFFEKLCASQQELGAEFEKTLYDNLWDLYES